MTATMQAHEIRKVYRRGRSNGLAAGRALQNARALVAAEESAGQLGRNLLRCLLDSEFYDLNRFAGCNEAWLSEPDRMDRCEEAAKEGGDGSTHGEIISDWREIAAMLTVDDDDEVETDIAAMTITYDDYDRLGAAIDAVECWHYANGTLEDEIG